MPITYSGRSVKPGGTEYPSLVDIAVGLSRQPRFAGQGQRWFSVLDHSLFVDDLVKQNTDVPLIGGEAHRPLLRMALLLHDAHEAITADVPTTFKGDELKREQDTLDTMIGAAFFPAHPYYHFQHPDIRNAVKWFDRRALAAEARVVGPSMTPERALEAFGTTDHTSDDVDFLSSLLEWSNAMGAPPTKEGPTNHPGVKEYLRRVLELL